jgi:dual specificity tyrosine-phosphorylation-regulated kinase 2/3/4
LNRHERCEILDYPEIYYCGLPSVKVSSGSFDLPTHHYRAQPRDHIAYRYEILSSFGQGAFGQVLKCRDHKTGDIVALKIVVNTRQMRSQGRAEMEFMTFLNARADPENRGIVKILSTFEFRGHVCAVFEPLGGNLYEFAKVGGFKGIPLSDARRISRQILSGLAFVHSHGIVHCDIKPENILLVTHTRPFTVRIIDFGSACRVGQPHYDYLQSRFYRAPEVILGLRYGFPIDIFSFGCVLAELVSGHPLFPGDSEAGQLRLQMEALGLPPAALLLNATRKALFFRGDGSPLATLRPRRPLARAVGSDDPLLLNLLQRCFEWDPSERITAQAALAHPFFAAQEAVPVETPRKRTPLKKGTPGVNVKAMSPRRIAIRP